MLADTIFSRFSKEADAVWRFQQGTTAAFARCNFTDNVIPTGAQGSVIGARAIEGQPYRDPSYLWIQVRPVMVSLLRSMYRSNLSRTRPHEMFMTCLVASDHSYMH